MLCGCFVLFGGGLDGRAGFGSSVRLVFSGGPGLLSESSIALLRLPSSGMLAPTVESSLSIFATDEACDIVFSRSTLALKLFGVTRLVGTGMVVGAGLTLRGAVETLPDEVGAVKKDVSA